MPPIPERRETSSRTQTQAAARLLRELAAARRLAQDAEGMMAAREVHRPIAARRAKLLHAVAVTVGVHTGRDHPAIPDGRGIVVDPKLRAELRALPLLPPAETFVRGARENEPIEVIRALLALELGLGHAAACRLAAAAAALPDCDAAIEILLWAGKAPHRATSALLKRLDRSGAYARWKVSIRQHAKHPGSVAGESAEDYEQRAMRWRKLAELHGLAIT